MKRTYLIHVVTLSLILAACSQATPPADGIWTATSELGGFTFEVASGGTEIILFEYEFSCQRPGVATTQSSTVAFVTPIPIAEGGFQIDLLSEITVSGEFSPQGGSATGVLTFMSCSAEWQASP